MAEHAIEPTTRSQQFYTAPAPNYPLGLPEFILPASNPTKELPQVGSINPVQVGPSKAAADSRLSIRNLVEASRDEQPLNRPSFTTNDSPMLAGQADREDNVLSTEAEAGPTERAASVAPAQIAGSKRKADDISIDAGSAAEELFKMYMETFGDKEAAVPAPAPVPAPTVAGTVERPAKRTRLITQAGKYAASAAVGSAAMFAFLVSPWCEQLLEWGAA
ncbi:hypothetical protein Tdes44962_MAKER09366 [Teratosphaeria destructans]|uniref:Uncharacterized protein n=1 Tax=Teratosphaeria destructans TaxID=418781 RepID=A0A9W7STR2_9PEZI|nr:hypothetical protein Tdes44962_MAKER09366 [Teratosphaeria destructans]